MDWFERQVERLRSLNPWLVDGALALVFAVLAVVTVFSQDVDGGMVEPDQLAALTAILTCVPLAFRRRAPLLALLAGCVFISLHIVRDYPEGTLPLTLLLLTYSVAAGSAIRTALVGLATVYTTLLVLVLLDAPGLNTVDFIGNLGWFGAAWTIGLAMRARRQALDARVSQAEERANFERQHAARVLAEERLRIARELHDVVAHSMSVIAVQAGVGAHVLDDRPEQARAALEAISATSRAALSEMRHMLGVLRSDDGQRSHQPTPGLVDLPQLVDDVRAAGVPVQLVQTGSCSGINPAIELSAYRVVQEALTNVIKHAGAPTRVDVIVDRSEDLLRIEVADDGRGAATLNGYGHGLIGMRERVELWGGDLVAGPVAGGGYRVLATLPYGAPE